MTRAPPETRFPTAISRGLFSAPRKRCKKKRIARGRNNQRPDQSAVSRDERCRRLIKRRRTFRCARCTPASITWSVVVYDYIVFACKKDPPAYAVFVQRQCPRPCRDITGRLPIFWMLLHVAKVSPYKHIRAGWHLVALVSKKYRELRVKPKLRNESAWIWLSVFCEFIMWCENWIQKEWIS